MPNLVDEISRLEAQGGTARIKFDSLSSNPSGNVIDVGGKEFRFRWSQEIGDLSDVYEECQSGEDGNGLLVESGSAWRKLNVQRILDESTTSRVKKLSEEAERQKESRKAIVLEHGNPSMKSQIKQLAAVETNPWKHFKQKKEPPSKKRKIEPPQGSHPKSAYKSGISSTTTIKSRHTSSPVPSPPEQSGPPTSPLRSVNISKNYTSAEDVVNPVIGKDKAAASSDKEIPAKATSIVREPVGRKSNIGAKPVDLQNFFINLLRENPKGMSMKALEKAVGESLPNSGRQIEAIMRKIATFQAPGRYLLKQGAESESFKKRSSESESSPEEKLHQTATAEDNRDQIRAPEPDFKERVPSDELEEQGQLNSKLGEEPTAFEKIDIQPHSPVNFGEKKVSDICEGHVGSSSDSGSDSDSESDSSDSGSDSGSPSRSRSPAGSGSGSSSDSDSDASSNSKEGSDEDVDIMTSDDDKEPKNKLESEPAFSRSPIQWGSPDGKPVQGDNDEKQDDHESDAVEIEKDVSDGNKQETEIAAVGTSAPHKDYENPLEKTNTFSPDRDELRQCQNLIGGLFNEGDDVVRDGSRHEHSDSSERISKGKYKRGMEGQCSNDKSENAKRSKADTSSQPPVSGVKDVQIKEISHRLPSDRPIEDSNRDPTIQGTNGVDRDGDGDLTLRKGNNQSFPGKPSADVQQSGRRSSEQSAPSKVLDSSEKMHNYAESLGHGRKYSGKSSHVHEGLPLQKAKFQKEAKYADNYANDKKVPRNPKEGGVRGKQSVPFDSHYRKHGEVVGKFKDGGQVSGSFLGSSPKDNSRPGADRSPVVNGKGNKLQREYSDLELGELREPLSEETPVKKQFERKGSFKLSENRPGHSTLDLGKSSSPDPNTKAPSNLEGSYKKRKHEDRVEELTRSQQRVVQSQPQSRVDNVESVFQSYSLAETNGGARQNEVEMRLGNAPEGYGDSNKKAPAPQLHDTRRETAFHSAKDRKRFSSGTVAELADGRTELLLAEGDTSERKRRDSSSDENSCSYSKYEKDEPDIKGPIKDLSQYKEYVQEYNDKYDSYCSLNKILESYRKGFQKLGKDLEHAKDRDMERYNNVLEQLKESYRQCGTRHKRLKKIFVVLHEELKHLKQRIKDFALSYSRD